MPETVIFALLAIAVFCKANAHIKTEGEYNLTWGNSKMGNKKFLLKKYWGKENKVKKYFSSTPASRMPIDFKNWSS